MFTIQDWNGLFWTLLEAFCHYSEKCFQLKMVPFRGQNSSTAVGRAVFNLEYCRAFQAQNISNSKHFHPTNFNQEKLNSVTVSLGYLLRQLLSSLSAHLTIITLWTLSKFWISYKTFKVLHLSIPPLWLYTIHYLKHTDPPLFLLSTCWSLCLLSCYLSVIPHSFVFLSQTLCPLFSDHFDKIKLLWPSLIFFSAS